MGGSRWNWRSRERRLGLVYLALGVLVALLVAFRLTTLSWFAGVTGGVWLLGLGASAAYHLLPSEHGGLGRAGLGLLGLGFVLLLVWSQVAPQELVGQRSAGQVRFAGWLMIAIVLAGTGYARWWQRRERAIRRAPSFPLRRGGYRPDEVDELLTRVDQLAETDTGRQRAIDLLRAARFAPVRGTGYDRAAVDARIQRLLTELADG